MRNPQPDESTEKGLGATDDPNAETPTFGYPPGDTFRVEEGSFCTGGKPSP